MFFIFLLSKLIFIIIAFGDPAMELYGTHKCNPHANNFFCDSGFNSAFQRCVEGFRLEHNNNGKFEGWCGTFTQMSFELGKPTSATYAFKLAFYKDGQLEEERKTVTFSLSGEEWSTIVE